MSTGNEGLRRFFSFTRDAIQQIRQDSMGNSQARDHRDQNSNSVETRVQNRMHINRTQVVVVVIKKQQLLILVKMRRNLCMPVSMVNRWYIRGVWAKTSETSQTAIFPNSPQRIASRFLMSWRTVPGRAKGMKPVYDEISFLFRLCERMKSGEFVPNLGIKVRDARHARRFSVNR